MSKVKSPEDFFNSLSTDIEERDKAFDSEEVETGTEVEDTTVEEEIELEDEVDEVEEETETEEEDVEIEETDEESESEEEEAEEAEQEDEEGLLEFEEEAPEEDVSSVAKELGFEGVKSAKDLKDKFEQKLKEAQEDAFEGIPDNLREAVRFAKEGGDFMAILDVTSADYDKIPNKDLVAASVEKYFTLEDGTIDEEGLQEWMDGKSKAEIAMMGDQIRQQAKSEQSAKIDAIKRSAAAEKEKSNKLLKESLERIDAIGGVKIKQSDKDELYSDTVSGQAMEELFYENGKISQRKLAENLFKVRKFDKAIAIAKNSAKTEGKREVLAKATNSTVKKKGSAPKAEVKKQSPMDMFYDMVTKRK